MAASRTPRTGSRRVHPGRVVALLVVGAYGLLALYPAWSMLVIASQPDDNDLSGIGLPSAHLFTNIQEVLAQPAFVRYIINSLIVAGTSSVLDVVIAAGAGYALARLSFPGRRMLLNLVIIALSLSPVVVAIPNYLLFATLGLLDTYVALILPVAVSALGVFLVRQYALAIPRQMLHAARVDGASELRIFWQIGVPLVRPALLTVLLLQFLAQWDNLFWPLIAANSQSLWTLPVGLAGFQGQYGFVFHLLMAAAVLSAIPPFIVFVVLQRHYVSGLTMGGVKR